ncbi:MAG: molybdopterin-guanine dinucleotide biosynthesis protein MobB [Alkalispirochaetaceae bacterium]
MVSVLGYAKSGKTTLLEQLCVRAVDRDLSVAFLKGGRLSHGGESKEGDTLRLARLGAQPSLLWSAEGLFLQRSRLEQLSEAPLPSPQEFAETWEAAVGGETRELLTSRDLLLLEGRVPAGARRVHMVRLADGALKVPPAPGEIVVSGPEEISRIVEVILAAPPGRGEEG